MLKSKAPILTLLWSQLSSILSAILYQRYYVVVDVELNRAKIDATLMYSFVFGLAVLWIFSFALFLNQINPVYIQTFYDTRTGSQYIIDLYRSGDDSKKISIFKNNVRQWSSIRGEVITWTTSNWKTWVETKPAWFTSSFTATVPDEFIPVQFRGKGRVGRGNSGINKSLSKVGNAPEDDAVMSGNATAQRE